MLASNVKISLFRIRAAISESLAKCHFKFKHSMPGRTTGKPRINVEAKRASILQEMVANKDKRKNWHFSVMSTKPQAKLFDKIHKPYRRRAVLNTLFIRNITDVISTGEIVPELCKSGIEITGVQVSPCYKMVNVFWQVPVSKYDLCENIGQLLNTAAPKIRAELISRNVLGRIPLIFFIRDCTNARVASFEQAMKQLESEPKSDSCIVADDSFVENIFEFRDAKSTLESAKPIKVEPKNENAIPKTPVDMKSDVFGLDHNELMQKVVALRKKPKSPPEKTAVISPANLSDEDDIFSKIPGIRFKSDSKQASVNREAIFKKFYIERKMLKEKNKNINYLNDYEEECYEDVSGETPHFIDFSSFDDDFIEDETLEK